LSTSTYWLDRHRLVRGCQILILIYLVVLGYWFVTDVWASDLTTLQNDFAAFWTVGHMVLNGRAVDAYLPELALAAEAEYIPEHGVRLPWFYPPQVFFLTAPFALLPFIPSFFLWSSASLAGLAWSVNALAPRTPVLWLLLASPGLFWVLRWGQTGLLAAALLGAALYCMNVKRPVLAGLCFGLLAFKPHFGLLVPFALIAGRQWTVFLSATLTALAILAMSTAVFEPQVWSAFFEGIEVAVTMQASGALPHDQMVSLYGLLRILGLSHTPALILQIILALIVLFFVVAVWRRNTTAAGAVLAAGSLLVAPHVLGYDLAVYAPALAILVADGFRRGWLAGEREGYMLLWLWPFFSGVLMELTGIPVGVAGSLLLFVLALRRAMQRLDHWGLSEHDRFDPETGHQRGTNEEGRPGLPYGPLVRVASAPPLCRLP